MTEKIHKGSGNVFADLGLDNSEELLTKAKLTSQINDILRRRKLTQKGAAALLGLAQSDVSNLRRGRLSGFSVERLFRLLNALDREVEIVVRRKISRRRPATTRVVVPKRLSV